MNKKEVLKSFKENIIPAINERYGKKDVIAKREAWSNYIDSLQKNGYVTEKQVTKWINPF